MANMTVADKFSKLPELAKPSLYEIRLAPCLKTFKFKGNEKIHLDVIFLISSCKNLSNLGHKADQFSSTPFQWTPNRKCQTQIGRWKRLKIIC